MVAMSGFDHIRSAMKANELKGLERWQSGRMHRTRNAAYSQGYRGFESLPLRHGLRPGTGLDPSVTAAAPHRPAITWNTSTAFRATIRTAAAHPAKRSSPRLANGPIS